MEKRKFLCVARSESGQCEPPSPDEMENMFAAFNAWKEKYAENLTDLGGKLGPEGKVVTSKGAADGPYAESKEIIGGYMILSAKSFEEAAEVVREIPGAGGPGSSIEIREILVS